MPLRSARNWLHGLWLLLFCLVVGAYLWWGRLDPQHPWWAAAAYGAAVVLAVSGHWIGGDSPRELGFRLDNWRTALARFGAFTGFGVAILVPLGFQLGHSPQWPSGAGVYLLWAALQQYLLQAFLLQRARGLCRSRPGTRGKATRSEGRGAGQAGAGVRGKPWLAALLAAGIFGTLHLPNFPLAAVTTLAGLGWCRLFLATPSLPAAWLSHGVLALVLLAFFKDAPLFNGFEVGRPGYRFEAYGEGIQVAAGRDAEELPFVVTLAGPRRGRPARVRVFRIDGTPVAAWDAVLDCPYGGRIAAGDVAPSPGDEVVVAAGPGPPCRPRVEIYDARGTRLGAFDAEVLPQGYGANVSVQGGAVLLGAGPGPEAAPLWAEYGGDGTLRKWGRAPTGSVFRNGIRWTRLPAGSSVGEEMAIFWGTPIAVNPATFVAGESGGTGRKRWIAAFPATYGLSPAPVRLGAGRWGVAVSLGPLVGYPRWVRIFAAEAGWPLVWQFAVEDSRAAAGLNLAAVDVDSDGRDELILGEGEGEGLPAVVRVTRLDGRVLYTWSADSR